MTSTIAAVRYESGGHTDPGRRDHNEDALLIDADLGLFVVADGVGGHHAGEIASDLTCEVIRREVDNGMALAEAILQANREVADAAASGRGESGMGSTVVAALLRDDSYEIAWIGDSRAYLWDGKLTLLTRDHSAVQALVAAGKITQVEAQYHPERNVIQQAVGLQPEDDIDVGRNHGRLGPGTSLLLCTDGLTEPLDNEQISQLLMRDEDASDTCERLVRLAVHCGGADNTTALVVTRLGEPSDADIKQAPAEIVWVYNPENGDYE